MFINKSGSKNRRCHLLVAAAVLNGRQPCDSVVHCPTSVERERNQILNQSLDNPPSLFWDRSFHRFWDGPQVLHFGLFCCLWWLLHFVWGILVHSSRYNGHLSSVQSLSNVQRFETPWTAACQALLSITNSQSLLKLMSIESVMTSNHLILCQSSSPPVFNLSQHQSLFKWVSSSHQVAKVLEFQLQHQSFQWMFKVDFL